MKQVAKTVKSRILVAVITMAMVFGNVGSPLAGSFVAYANDDQATATMPLDQQTPDGDDQKAEDAEKEDEENTDDQSSEDTGSDDNAALGQTRGASDDGTAEDQDADKEDKKDENLTKSGTVDAVYVGGQNASSENDGLSPETPVATWEEAVKILGNNPGTIYVCGTLVVSGEISLPNPQIKITKKDLTVSGDEYKYPETYEDAAIDKIESAQVVKRAPGFNGDIFKIESANPNATFKNIYVDGEERDGIGTTAISMGWVSNAEVSILDNAVFANLYTSGNGGAVWMKACSNAVLTIGKATFYNNKAKNGGAIYFYNHFSEISTKDAKLNIDGAGFYRNTAQTEGGAICVNGYIVTTIKSGDFVENEANRGSVLTNYNHSTDNLITVYNALITKNKSTGTTVNNEVAIKRSGVSAGGINICQAAGAEITICGDLESGAAIYDNPGPKGDVGVWDDSDLSKLKINEGTMLGGGNHNWDEVEGDNPKGYYSSPSENDVKKADPYVSSRIIKNEAVYHGAIQSNGIVTLGSPQASLRIKKVDGKTGAALDGVVFKLSGETSSGRTIEREATTFIDPTDKNADNNGLVSFTDVPVGKYKLEEVTTKEGYKKTKTTWSVVVEKDGNVVMKDQDGNEVDRQNAFYDYIIENEPIEVKISKNKLGGSEIEGAQMTLTMPDGTTKTWTSSATEAYTFNAVAGKYTLQEVAAPEGFEPVITIIEFEVDEYGDVTILNADKVDEEGAKVSLKDETTNHIVLEDAPYKEPQTEKYVNKVVTEDFDYFDEVFEYEIMAYVPYDANKLSITDPLVNALEFANGGNVKVYNMGSDNDHKPNGTVAEEGTEITDAEITVNEEEKKLEVKIDDATAYRRNWIKVTFDAQIDPDQYEKVAELIAKRNAGEAITDADWASVTENGFVLTEEKHDGVPNKATYHVETKNNGEFNPETNTVTVEPKTVNLKVKKSWWKNIIWPENTTVTFAVYQHKDGAEVKVDEITLSSTETSKTVTLPRLEGVTYNAKEVKVTKNGQESTLNASGNLVIGTINYLAEVVEEVFAGESDGSHETKNTIKVDVKINKTDLGGEELDNATIVVYKGDEVVASWKSKKGETFDLQLEPGEYSFEETVAPKGYDCVETKVDFTVDQDGKVTVNKIEGQVDQNADGTIVLLDTPIRKISKQNLGGEELDGAEMTLTMPDGTTKEWTSSTKEEFTFNAVPGEYTLKEIAAPKGYEKVETDVKFTVDDHGNITVNEVMQDGEVVCVVDGDTVVLKDAPTKPEVEKYVNKAVHKYIGLDEVFTYDIVGYISMDAESITFEDVLVEDLEFVSDKDSVEVVYFDKNNHKPLNDIDGELANEDASVAQEGEAVEGAVVKIDGQTLTVSIDDKEAAKKLRGKYVKVTFKAQIDEELQAAIKAGDKKLSELSSIVPIAGDENNPVLSDQEHTGIKNEASLKIKVGNEGKYDVNSNVVTVKPELPEIEKYVNQAVHKDIDLDEEFTYDVIAYVTKDAGKVVIKDKLVEDLQFACEASDVKVADLGDSVNHEVTNSIANVKLRDYASVAAEGTEIGSAVPSIEGDELTVTIEDAKEYRGHWVRVTFKAKLADGKKVKDLKYTTIKDADPEDRDAPNKGNDPVKSDDDHTGVPNTASYTIFVKNTASVSEEGSENPGETPEEPKYKDESNTVTVKPEEHPVSISKQDLGGDELEGAKIKVVDEDGNLVDEWTSSENEPHVLKLTEGTYKMTELAAPDGYQCVKTDITFTVDKDGKVIVDEIEGVVEKAEDGTIILKNAPEKPAIEKYVNKKTDDLSDTERDGTVHYDLSAFNEVYTYDIQAYITADATIVEVNDELKEVLEFVGDAPTSVVVKDGEGQSKAVAPKLTKAGEAVDYTIDEDAWDEGKLVLTIGSDAEDAPKLYPNGKWLQITFDAKIKDKYKSLEAIKAADGVFTKITVNEEIDDADVNATFSGAEADAHEGIVNDSSYRMKSKYASLNVNVDNEWAYGVQSNTVTVVPPTTEVTFSKTDLGGEEIPGATIKVVTEDGTEVDSWTSTTEDHVLHLPDGTYTMTEVVAPEGYQTVTTEMVFVVEDGKVTLETTEVNGGGKVRVEDMTHVILEDAPEKPAIEKYVNKKTDDLSDTERDGTVHTDLSAFDEVYTYDIQAYITADATYVEVTDELKEVLEFVGDEPTAVVVKDGEGQSKAEAPKLSKAGEAVDYTIDKSAWKKGKLVLIIGSDAEDAPKLYPNGKWLQITFDAKIKSQYKSIEALKAAGEDVWKTVTENECIDDADVVDEFSGAEVDSHEGIANDSSYRVKSAVVGLNVDNGWAYEVKSNTVTVQPKSTEVSFSKQDLFGDELEGAKIKLTDAEGNVIDEWTSTKENHVLNLADGEYVMTEVVAPAGYYCVTTKMRFEIKGEKAILLTAEVDNGGILTIDGNNVILQDCPIVQKDYEPEKDNGKRESYVKGANTGNNNLIVIWTLVLILSISAIALVTIKRRREER